VEKTRPLPVEFSFVTYPVTGKLYGAPPKTEVVSLGGCVVKLVV
jgi:hypothetical protein